MSVSLGERNQRIDSACSPGGYGARYCGDRREQTRHHRQHDGIQSRHAEQLALERMLQTEGADCAEGQADRGHDQALVHDQPEHRTRGRSEGEADPDLLPPMGDDVGYNPRRQTYASPSGARNR